MLESVWLSSSLSSGVFFFLLSSILLASLIIYSVDGGHQAPWLSCSQQAQTPHCSGPNCDSSMERRKKNQMSTVFAEIDPNFPKCYGKAQETAEKEAKVIVIRTPSHCLQQLHTAVQTQSPKSSKVFLPSNMERTKNRPQKKLRIFLVGDLQKGRLSFPISTVFLPLIPLSAPIKVRDVQAGKAE